MSTSARAAAAAPARAGAVRAERVELLVVAALAIVAVAAWAIVPTYPNYDTYYHLVWGRELLDGTKPTFTAYAAPTEHPLFLVLCALAGLLGSGADRVMVLVCALSLVALVWGTYRVGEAVFGRWPGVLGALFVGSSFAFLLYAARAYVDVPFLAIVLWAAALEARTPRRGRTVMALLAVAGLLRPGGVGPRGRVLAVVHLASGAVGRKAPPRPVRPGHRRAAAVGARRPLGHRRPAVLAARHERPRRRAQPQPRAGRRPRVVRVVRRRRGAAARRPRGAGRGGAGVAPGRGPALRARADRALRRRAS